MLHALLPEVLAVIPLLEVELDYVLVVALGEGGQENIGGLSLISRNSQRKY